MNSMHEASPAARSGSVVVMAATGLPIANAMRRRFSYFWSFWSSSFDSNLLHRVSFCQKWPLSTQSQRSSTSLAFILFTTLLAHIPPVHKQSHTRASLTRDISAHSSQSSLCSTKTNCTQAPLAPIIQQPKLTCIQIHNGRAPLH